MKFISTKEPVIRTDLRAALFKLEDSEEKCLAIAVGDKKTLWMYENSNSNYIQNTSLVSYDKLNEALVYYFPGDKITFEF